MNAYFAFAITWIASTAIGLLLYRSFSKENGEITDDVGMSALGGGAGAFGGMIFAAAFSFDEFSVPFMTIAILLAVACSIGVQRSFGSWIDGAD
jgi:hypothetical protein